MTLLLVLRVIGDVFRARCLQCPDREVLTRPLGSIAAEQFHPQTSMPSRMSDAGKTNRERSSRPLFSLELLHRTCRGVNKSRIKPPFFSKSEEVPHSND